MDTPGKSREFTGIQTAVCAYIDGNSIAWDNLVQKGEFDLRRLWTVDEMPSQPKRRKCLLERIFRLSH
ncbi:hypothetical protein ABTN51_20495, partial [Acinetobacter baumannii]